MNIYETRREQLRQLIARDYGGVQSAFAEAINRQPDYVSRVLNGKKGLGEDLAREIERILGKPRLTLDRALGVAEPEAAFQGLRPGPSLSGGLVPIISSVQAGSWDPAEDQHLRSSAIEEIACPAPHSSSSYALVVEGDSMTSPHPNEDSYREGSIIFVDPELRSPINGDHVIAKLVGEDLVIFKVFVRDAGKVWLKPLNPDYPLIHDEFRVLGTVIGSYWPRRRR